MSELESEPTAVESVIDEIKQADENYGKWRKSAEKSFMWGAAFLGGAAITLANGEAVVGGAMAGGGVGMITDGFRNLNGAAHVSRHRAALTQALAQHGLTSGEVIEIYPEENEVGEEEQAAPPTSPIARSPEVRPVD